MIEPPDQAAGAQVALNDCRNTIGIQGDRSCPQLVELVHCRNCPVYTDVAIQILESRSAAHDDTGAVSAAEGTPAGSSRLVTFRLGSEHLALPAACIEEITQESPVHSLPHRRSKLPIGLVNVRGELLLFVDLAALLGTEPSGPAAEKNETPRRHVVFGHAGSRFVFRTDEVRDVLLYREEDLAPVPTTLPAASFTAGLVLHPDRVIACLAAENLVAALNREVA